MALDPDVLTGLAGGRTSIVVSGTNGKTTTSHLLAAALPDGAQRHRLEHGRRRPFAALEHLPPGGADALANDSAFLDLQHDSEGSHVPHIDA